MTRTFSILTLLIVLPLAAIAQDKTAPPAWEMLPYRIQLLVAVEADPSLPPKLEQELIADIPARAASAMGGAWRLECGSAPTELRHSILHSLAKIAADDLPAAAKKGDKTILLGIAAGTNGYVVRGRELDSATGLWNTVSTRNVRQSAALKQDALWCLLSAFAPQSRIEKVEDKIVTLRLRAAALARRDANLAPVLSGTVFRPVLLKSDARGAHVAGSAEPIGWTYLIPTEPKVTSPQFTARIESGLSGTAIPEYHPLRTRLALGISPSQDTTTIKLVAEGSSAPLEGYEVAAQEPDVAGKPGKIVSLGRSGPDGMVAVPPGRTAVRSLLFRHGSEVLTRLPLVPGLAEEMTLTLPDDRPRLAVEIALGRIQDDLVDLVARREVLVSRIKAAGSAGNAAAADKLKEQLKKLPSPETALSELTKQQQPAEALEGSARQKMLKKLSELRALAEKLKGENPASKL